MSGQFKNILKNKGQALLFVLVALTIAITLGVAVSTRTLQMSSRVSRTDTSARVFAAAEGGLEMLLVQKSKFLNDLSAGNADCTSVGLEAIAGDNTRCLLRYEKASGDKIESVAVLSAKVFRHTDILGGTPYYGFTLAPNETKNIELTGMNSIRLCWENPDTAVEYVVYGDTVVRNFLKAAGSVSFSSDISSTGFTELSSHAIIEGYPLPYCSNINVSGASGMRVKSIFKGTRAAIVPLNPTSLPPQGFRLYSRGELSQEGDIKTTRAKFLL